MNAPMWQGPLLVLAAWVVQGAWPLAAHSASSPIQAFAGHWQVRQVLLDEERTDRFLYQFNDPRLVGRMVSIDERRIESDLPEASGCARPVLVSEPQALNTLLGQTMLSALSGQDAARAFGLKVPGTDVVNAVWISCATSRFGPSLKGTPAASLNKPGRTWMALSATNQLLMRWYGETVLVLEPRTLGRRTKTKSSGGRARLPAAD